MVTFPSLHENPVVPGTGGRRFKVTDDGFGVSYRGPQAEKALEIVATSVVFAARQRVWFDYREHITALGSSR